jgi:hypothetical protein
MAMLNWPGSLPRPLPRSPHDFSRLPSLSANASSFFSQLLFDFSVRLSFVVGADASL